MPTAGGIGKTTDQLTEWANKRGKEMQKGRGREGEKGRKQQHVGQCKRQWLKVEIKCKIVHAIIS